jgi:hypothetical protein
MLIHIWQITVNGQRINFATETLDMVEAVQLFKDKFQKENPNRAFNADKIQWMDSVKFIRDKE